MTPTPEWAWEIGPTLQAFLERTQQVYTRHLEQMCAAYLQCTDIPPDQVELICEMRTTADGISQRVYYCRRKP